MPEPRPLQTYVRVEASARRALAAGEIVALLGDTHMPRGRRRLPGRCHETIAAATLAIHTGDISTAATLTEFAAIGPPLHAVHGNVDEPALRERLPQALTVDIGPRRLVVVHDSGPKRGRIERLRKRFPDADAVVFGHSHIPLHERDADGFQIFNPGSPTERRRSPAHTMGSVRLAGDELDFDLFEVG